MKFGVNSDKEPIQMWQRAESIQALVRKREEVEVVKKMLPEKVADEMSITKVRKHEPVQAVEEEDQVKTEAWNVLLKIIKIVRICSELHKNVDWKVKSE